MKNKFKIIDASTKEKFKLSEGQMIVMNNQGLFFLVGNFRDYDTYVQKLSDVCPKYDVIWNNQPEQGYTGTGSDYLDCVLGLGGFEQYKPIKGVKGLTDE